MVHNFLTYLVLHFNSQPREGGWLCRHFEVWDLFASFQLTAARRRLVSVDMSTTGLYWISTHSRAKAAGGTCRGGLAGAGHFNSQPREGGWKNLWRRERTHCYFNSQPREGGWPPCACNTLITQRFQLTAARRRLEQALSEPSSGALFQLTAARRRLVSPAAADQTV